VLCRVGVLLPCGPIPGELLEIKEYSDESPIRVRPSSISFPATAFAAGGGSGIRRLNQDPLISGGGERGREDDEEVTPIGVMTGAGRGTRRSGSRGRGASTPAATPRLQRASQLSHDRNAPSLSYGGTNSLDLLTGGTTGLEGEAYGLGLGLPDRFSFPPVSQAPGSGRPSLSTLLAQRTRSLARFHLSSLAHLRPRFPPNPSKALRPIRFQTSFLAKAHHLFLPFISFAHVPATLFLDFNALYAVAQLAVHGDGNEVGWYIALGVYAASDLGWLLGIVVGVEGVRCLTRSWSKSE